MSPPAGERRYRVAGLWRRALTGALDAVVLLPLMALFATVTAALGGHPLRSLGELGPSWAVELAIDGGSVGLAALLMAAIVAFLYFFVFHLFRGQTPGQRLLRLRVVDVYGERPSVTRVLVRSAAWFVSLAGCGLGLLWIGFDREKRGLHDWLAGTYVVIGGPQPAVAEEPATVETAPAGLAKS
jgi:uncharacterized RDD family membrane protein YckC